MEFWRLRCIPRERSSSGYTNHLEHFECNAYVLRMDMLCEVKTKHTLQDLRDEQVTHQAKCWDERSQKIMLPSPQARQYLNSKESSGLEIWPATSMNLQAPSN